MPAATPAGRWTHDAGAGAARAAGGAGVPRFTADRSPAGRRQSGPGSVEAAPVEAGSGEAAPVGAAPVGAGSVGAGSVGAGPVGAGPVGAGGKGETEPGSDQVLSEAGVAGDMPDLAALGADGLGELVDDIPGVPRGAAADRA